MPLIIEFVTTAESRHHTGASSPGLLWTSFSPGPMSAAPLGLSDPSSQALPPSGPSPSHTNPVLGRELGPYTCWIRATTLHHNHLLIWKQSSTKLPKPAWNSVFKQANLEFGILLQPPELLGLPASPFEGPKNNHWGQRVFTHRTNWMLAVEFRCI